MEKKLYANFYLNNTDNIKIKVKESKPEEDEYNQNSKEVNYSKFSI